MTTVIGNIQIDLELSGSQRPIKLPTLHSFIYCFCKSKHIYFQIKELRFGFSELGIGHCVSQFRFVGGSRNYPHTWREHTVEFRLSIPLYDLIQYMATKKWFIETKPIVRLGYGQNGGAGVDFLSQFTNWDMNLGKNECLATPRQIAMHWQARKDTTRLLGRLRQLPTNQCLWREI